MADNDLISRSALIDRYYAEYEKQDICDGAQDRDWLKKCFDEAPTIDPESLRPTGRWELHGNDDDCGRSYFCSNCYRSYPEEWFYDHGQYVPFENCPHCTAKMEG